MSFLDKVTKAVGDVVDKGKKDVDQFMRIQKINGEIGAIEKKIAEFRNQIQQAKAQSGEKAIELLRGGALVSSDLQAFVGQIAGIEQQIVAEEASVADKKADIAKIKAEHDAEPVAPATAAPATKVCAQCGAPSTGGAFCPQCGAKQG
jgi:wobble nucleotide-excising tRNase